MTVRSLGLQGLLDLVVEYAARIPQ